MRNGMSATMAAREAIQRVADKYPDFMGGVVTLSYKVRKTTWTNEDMCFLGHVFSSTSLTNTYG